MLMAEPGCTVANPPDTASLVSRGPLHDVSIRLNVGQHTEELLGAATLLNNFDNTRLELLDRWDVVCEDTHLARFRGDVDLDDVLGLVDGLAFEAISSAPSIIQRTAAGQLSFEVSSIALQSGSFAPGEEEKGSA